MDPGTEAPGATPTIETPAISKLGEAPPTKGTLENLQREGGKPLPDALYQERAAIVVALRNEGYTNKEIAEATGLTHGQVKYALIRARAANQIQDVATFLANRALPQAAENLVRALEDDKDENHWRATEKTLEGLGAFKSHKNTVQEGTGTVQSLNVVFQMLGGGDIPTVIVNGPRGEIGGVPRVDAE